VTAYDLILVYALGRMHNHYLNVVKHLAGRLRIGIYAGPIQKKVKTAETEQTFLGLARALGAQLLDGGPHRARLVVVPQFPWEPGEPGALLGSRVRGERLVATQTFGYGTQYLDALAAAGITRLLVYDRRVFENKLKTEDERRWVAARFEVVEMGAPFARYPVFDGPATDYLVALPTELSFLDGRAKAAFARNVVRLVGSLPDDLDVVLKLHNVSDGGRLMERQSRAFRMGERVGRLGGLPPAPPAPGRLGEGLARLAFGAAFGRLGRRGRLMNDLTPYFNLGLELFLPHVRRGLVTGRSSVVWYALVNRLPVYNCDDETVRARSDGVLDSYRAFGVPPCHGRPAFDARAFDRIAESVREADLLELLQKEL
jgi:hypothetical protein